MKKKLLSSLVILSFALSPCLRAEETAPAAIALQAATDQLATPLATDPVTEPATEQEGAQVSPASKDSKSPAKRRQLRNIAIAVGAVAVAVVALILVSSHNGHEHH